MGACTARVLVTHTDEATARTVLEALRVDDDAHCQSRLDGPRTLHELTGSTPRSLLRALDDLLACLAVAEDVIKRA